MSAADLPGGERHPVHDRIKIKIVNKRPRNGPGFPYVRLPATFAPGGSGRAVFPAPGSGHEQLDGPLVDRGPASTPS